MLSDTVKNNAVLVSCDLNKLTPLFALFLYET
jgi:hypothetical protein